MNPSRALCLIALAMTLPMAAPAVAQSTRPAESQPLSLTLQPATLTPPASSGPPLPEGFTLDSLLDYAAKPPPASFPSPVDDNAIYSWTLFELLEYRFSDKGRDEVGWDVQGWVGNDDHKFWWKTEGAALFDGPDNGEGEVQALYATPISPFWYFQVGTRFDVAYEPGETDERFSGVIGLQGIAPYQFELEPTLFITDDGDVLPRFTASYYLYLTQRLVLQPRVEIDASFQDVPESGLGAGLNEGAFDLRLLYEIKREFAPYVGVRYRVRFGETGDIAERNGQQADDVQFVLGARLVF